MSDQSVALEHDDVDLAGARMPGELQVGGRDPCELMSHEMVVAKASGMVVVRIFKKASTDLLKHVGMTPLRAFRLGAKMIQAAILADPKLIPLFEELIATARRGVDGGPLRVVKGEDKPR